jgi:hypothetical protein
MARRRAESHGGKGRRNSGAVDGAGATDTIYQFFSQKHRQRSPISNKLENYLPLATP